MNNEYLKILDGNLGLEVPKIFEHKSKGKKKIQFIKAPYKLKIYLKFEITLALINDEKLYDLKKY